MTALCALAAVPPGWIRFSSPECEYSVSLPGKPVDKIEGAPNAQIDGPGGKVRTWFAPTSRALYSVTCTTFSTDFSRNEHFLEGVRDRNVKQFNGRLLSDLPIALGEWRGRRYSLEATVKNIRNVGYIQTLDVGKYVYTLMVASQPDVVSLNEETEVQPFFDSFSFTGKSR